MPRCIIQLQTNPSMALSPDICIYDAQIDECGGLTKQALVRMLAEPSDGADALCVYTTVYADSGCLDVEDPTICESNTNCTLFGENGNNLILYPLCIRRSVQTVIFRPTIS